MLKNLFINPVIATVTSLFGKRIAPEKNASILHNGIDLACRLNSQILCPADGIVSIIGQDLINGLYLKITHDNGYITGYAHLASISVFLNQYIHQRFIIGYTGMTGCCTGPCLHFTLRQGTDTNGLTINPTPYFDFKTKQE